MARYNLLQKCDRALVAFIISEGAGTAKDVFPGKASQDKTLPVTICESRTAKPITNPPRGIYEVEACIYVRTQGSLEDEDNQADTPATIAADRVGLTFDAFHPVSDQSGEILADTINAASAAVQDFTIQSAEVTEMRAGFLAKGDAWCDILDLRLIVVAASGV